MFNQVDEFVKISRLNPGDAVIVKKRFLGLLKHYVIYLGRSSNGKHLFIANMEPEVQILSQNQICEYLKYFDPKKIIPFKGSDEKRRLAIERALSYPQKYYHLLANNCEHFFNYIHKGRGYSSQTADLGYGLTISGILMIGNSLSSSQSKGGNGDIRLATGILLTGIGLYTVSVSKHD